MILIDTLSEFEEELDKVFNGEYSSEDVVFYNAGEAEAGYKTDYSTIKTKSFVEVTGNFFPNEKQYSYPLYWLVDTICQCWPHPDHSYKPPLHLWQKSPNPKELFCAMMGQPRPHRIMVFDILEWMGVTSPYMTEIHKGRCIDVKEDDIFKNDDFIRVIWQGENRVLTHRFPNFYEMCLIDIVMETFCDKMFFTEKTWKPFLGMRIPFIFGMEGQMHLLADMWDFRWPDEMNTEWEHSRNPYIRAKLMIQELKRLQSLDLVSLHKDSLINRKHNQKRCFEILDCVEWDSSIPPHPDYEDKLKHAKLIRDYWWKNR